MREFDGTSKACPTVIILVDTAVSENMSLEVKMITFDRQIYLVHRDVVRQQKYIEDSRTHVWRSVEEEDLAVYWLRDVQKPLNKIPDEAEDREVRDLHNHMSVCDLQRLQDAHSILSDVDDRQQAVNTQRWERKELLNFCFTAGSSLPHLYLSS